MTKYRTCVNELMYCMLVIVSLMLIYQDKTMDKAENHYVCRCVHWCSRCEQVISIMLSRHNWMTSGHDNYGKVTLPAPILDVAQGICVKEEYTQRPLIQCLIVIHSSQRFTWILNSSLWRYFALQLMKTLIIYSTVNHTYRYSCGIWTFWSCSDVKLCHLYYSERIDIHWQYSIYFNLLFWRIYLQYQLLFCLELTSGISTNTYTDNLHQFRCYNSPWQNTPNTYNIAHLTLPHTL